MAALFCICVQVHASEIFFLIFLIFVKLRIPPKDSFITLTLGWRRFIQILLVDEILGSNVKF